MKTVIRNGVVALSFIGIFTTLPAFAFESFFTSFSGGSCGSQITRTLSVGSENEEVYLLQEALSQNGYLIATPNGYFGPATRQAVVQFQRDNGLYTTGVVGEATRDAINNQLCSSDIYGGYPYNVSYGNMSNVTYVNTYDPYVKNITHSTVTSSYPYEGTAGSYYNSYNAVAQPITQPIIPATTNTTFTQNANIVYSPNIGYIYGITPSPASLTITSPGVNSHYNEGDTVSLAWTTSNMNVNQYQILLENTSTGQSKIVVTTTGNNASFVLTKELLDQVCTGSCSQSYVQGSYRVVITTPIIDIAGVTSPFRASVSPITIKRPYSFYGNVTISGSKNPVSSGEVFKLYINIPASTYYNANVYGQYSMKISAICPSTNVQVMVAGVMCGQDFTIPFTINNVQQEIPARITNNTYYKQDITFVVSIINPLGQVVGTSQTIITGNAMPFAW